MGETDLGDRWLTFDRQTVFVIGGGPSLKSFDFRRLDGHRVIAVNAAAYDIAADVLFFGDYSWFQANRAVVDAWRGLIVSPTRQVAEAYPGRAFTVDAARRVDFPRGHGPIRTGVSSGQLAVSLAISMGARRVILLGFDMQAVGGALHYHEGRPLYTVEHDERAASLYPSIFLPPWEGWHAAALAAGCDVLNASPISALDEFPRLSAAELDRHLRR